MEWLAKIAPTAATLLGGPLAGMAVDAIGGALGIKDATKDQIKQVLSSGNLNAEQMAALKKVEADLTIRLKELDIKAEEIAAADRNSAREMAVKTGDVWTPRIMCAVTFIIWCLVNYKLFNGTIASDMRELVARALGTLDAVLMAAVYYYYGSSAGSKEKTDAMAAKR